MENKMQADGLRENDQSGLSWVETRRKIKNRWNKLSSEQLDGLEDQHSLLPEQLVKAYGFSQDFAESEADTFFEGIKSKDNASQEPTQLGKVDQVSAPKMNNHNQPRADRFPHDNSPYFDDQP